jgi:hypothetical protein
MKGKSMKTVESRIKEMSTHELAIYLHSWISNNDYSEIEEIENILLTPLSVYEDPLECGVCQNEEGCLYGYCRDENIPEEEKERYPDRYYHNYIND